MLCSICWLRVFFVTVLPLTCAGQDWTFYSPSGAMQVRQAPQQAASQNRYKISGTVTNSVTGEPIGRAVVRTAYSQQVFTDGSGHFEMSDVPEGQLFLSAQRPGFIDSQTNGHPPQLFKVGPAMPSIQIKLTPEGFIKGKVVNEQGEPLENVGIQVLSQQIMNGRKSWLNRGGAQTDEDGAYQVENLPPGQYLIHTSTIPLFPTSMAAENGPLNQIYPPQYFPNAPSQESAQPLTVQAGQTAEADLQLSPTPSYSISGTVSESQAKMISCEDNQGNVIGHGRTNHQTGQFKFVHIPAGSCTLTARAQSPDGRTYYAEQPVTVTSSNLTNVHLTLEPLPEIPVHFSSSNSGIPAQLRLLARSKHWQNGQFYPNSSDGQNFAFKNIPPGAYQVTLANFNNNACVSAINSGSTDLLRNDLTVVSGTAQIAPIEVTMSSDCATLTVSLAASSPDLKTHYLLVPDSAGMEPHLITTSGNSFEWQGLTPGEYTVYAFSDISGLEYANPEAMREFSGQKVTLGAGQKSTVQLNLITRGGSQ